MSANTAARSWFCVLNSPADFFGDIEPTEMVQKAISLWIEGKEDRRSCAVNYEIGDTGNHHMHMVLCDKSVQRFSAIKKLFPPIHVEPTRGTKEQAQDYIEKKGKFEEKGHTVVVPAVYHGDIIGGGQGKRNDLQKYRDMIEQGLTPNEIFDDDIRARKYESMIRKDYFRKRYLDTPIVRDVRVIWHVGDSGTGKSFSYVNLCNENGDDNVYLVSQYSYGAFDNYGGEPILFMDEFKGAFYGGFGVLLTYLDKYRIQLQCRYSNSYALWNEVHITSVYTPNEIYDLMVPCERREIDGAAQLLRRLSEVRYHFKMFGEYHCLSLNPSDCKKRSDIMEQVNKAVQSGSVFEDSENFVEIDS